MKVGIIGASGYGGLELIRLLHNHPEVEQIELFTSSEEGTVFSHKYSHLMNIVDQPLQKIELERLAEFDVVFSSAPAGVASTLASSVNRKRTKAYRFVRRFPFKRSVSI